MSLCSFACSDFSLFFSSLSRLARLSSRFRISSQQLGPCAGPAGLLRLMLGGDQILERHLLPVRIRNGDHDAAVYPAMFLRVVIELRGAFPFPVGGDLVWVKLRISAGTL